MARSKLAGTLGLPGSPETDPLTFFATLFDIESASRAILGNTFDLEEEVSLLITGMRDPDPSIRLSAQAAYRRLLKDITTANSVHSETTRISQDASGALIHEKHSVDSLLTRLHCARRPSLPSAPPERLPSLSLHDSNPSPDPEPPTPGPTPPNSIPGNPPPRTPSLGDPDPDPLPPPSFR